jgi:hypothetical protein
MADKTWLRPHQAEEALGMSRQDLFKMRDNGTLKLGPHYAAFPETRCRKHLSVERQKCAKDS